MAMNQSPDLAEAIDRLAGARVMVIGDVMLDRFIYGGVERISPEAPVPVLRVETEESMPGGAGNVLRNLVAIGARVCFVAVVGDDQVGRDLISMIAREEGVEPYVLVERNRVSTRKDRFVDGGHQLLRADHETDRAILPETASRIVDIATHAMSGVDVLVLSDYAKGVMTVEVTGAVIAAARHADIPVIVDPKSHTFSRYRRASVLTPNRQELAMAARMEVNGDGDIVAAARTVMEESDAGCILVTRSAAGMSLIERDGTALHLPAEVREVYDVSGAGDTVVAVFAAALGQGLVPETAARLANLAGGAAVGKSGTAVVGTDDLRHVLHGQAFESNEAKIVSLETARDMVASWRDSAERIGFTNGCFDLLHPGHVSLLRQARQQCDRLVVALNSDSSVEGLKGPGRPVQSEISRAQILASMADVDLVVVFSEATPVALIECLRPDVLVKGSDYRIDEVVGADIVTSYGGRVYLADLVDGFSTTATVTRMSADANGR